MDFEAFVEFSDLGLDDYIIDLDWDIQAKRFLPSHHTAGDLRAINVGQKQSKKQKVFKTLGPLKRENSEPVNIHDSGYNLDAPAVEGNQTQSDSERNVILNTAEKITEILGDKIVNEVINHNSFSENVNVKIEESVTNISDVLNQKIEQSKKTKQTIEYYSFKYPFNKFINEDSVIRICQKYSLLLTNVDRFIGSIPEKNQKEIIKI